ncbi:hypothetical protein OAO87_00980 [bacterium]|nr:hypothetical protein [bacterium]
MPCSHSSYSAEAAAVAAWRLWRSGGSDTDTAVVLPAVRRSREMRMHVLAFPMARFGRTITCCCQVHGLWTDWAQLAALRAAAASPSSTPSTLGASAVSEAQGAMR